MGFNIDLGTFKVADIYELLGKLYYSKNRFSEAEKVLADALNLREADRDNTDDICMADTCVELAKVYFMGNKHFESENLYNKALDIYRKHDSDKVEPVDISIAKVSPELGNLYYMINRHADAAKMFLNSKDKYFELVNSGKTNYSATLADAC